MSSPDRLLRSYLYAPGAQPRLLDKAVAAGADAVICDLEDSVGAADKLTARAAVAAFLRERAGDPGRGPGATGPELHVRINRAPAGGYDLADLAGVTLAGLAAVRLPKAVDAAEVAAAARLLDRLEPERGLAAGAIRLYPAIESAAGVAQARALAAAPRVVHLAFGSADFLADIGAHGGDGREATLLARSTLVLASRAAGIGPPVDGAYTDLADQLGLRESTRWARSLGFFGRAAIHPRQLAAIHEVFTPTTAELAWAQQVVAGAGAAATAVVAGEFVDAPVLRRARALLALGEAAP